jgi:hypothetical protein
MRSWPTDRMSSCTAERPGNAPWLRPLAVAGIPTAIHLDGLESRRQKRRASGPRTTRWAERAAVAWGTEVIADAEAIARHVRQRYGRECVVIPYGAQVIHPGTDRLGELNCAPGTITWWWPASSRRTMSCRPCRASGAAALRSSSIVVGDAPYSQDYIQQVRMAAADERIRLVGSIYDAEASSISCTRTR